MLEKWKLKAGNPKVYNLSADGLSVFIDFISDVEEALGCKVIEVGAIG